MRTTYSPGKVDYNRSGRRNCKADFEISLENGLLSICANIWNPRESDIYLGGQAIEEVASYFPGNAKVARIVAIWRDWHLNDMQAGSPAQMAWLDANPIDGNVNHYSRALAALTAAGLNPDPSFEHNGKPYVYGSAWLRKELPAEIIAEVESWA